MNNCRVCGNKFFKEPLLRYENMPKAAQFLPDKVALKSDKGVNLEVRQCSGCGLVQLASPPVPYYRQVIRSSGFSQEMKDFRRRQFLSFVKRFYLKGKKVIEIGCGCGEYLSIMRRAGVKAYGVEYSRESVNKCVKNNLKVEKGFVGDAGYKLKHAPFEAFFILSFLEHLPDPNLVLKGISDNLSEGAVGLVEVPNFDMILRKKLFCEFIGDHLFYFTKETLNTALELNGFEVVECNEVWHEYIISAIVKKRKKLDLTHFNKHRERLKNNIKEYIRCFKDKKVAIWGAGHQALAIISLLDLAGQISYVVDSAPFKQDKFTPATHVPIVSPERLAQEPQDAVIVMAASYSDEVARVIRQKFGKKINIAILRDFGLEEV